MCVCAHLGELPARRFNCRGRWTRRRPVSELDASFRLTASPAELLFCRGDDFSGLAGRAIRMRGRDSSFLIL